MEQFESPNEVEADDEHILQAMGYKQELARLMSDFSHVALSQSIISILSGAASIGLGGPFTCVISLAVATSMAQRTSCPFV